jgi:hypothetical protein
MYWLRQILLTGFFGLVFFMFLDLFLWFFPPHRGWAFWQWDSSGPVAVGAHYALELQTRPANLLGMAEYDQRVVIYGGTARSGKELATIDLPMNTGGRTHILVYRSLADANKVVLRDRYGDHVLDLTALRVEPFVKGALEHPLFLGTLSERAFPLKFIPAGVVSEQEAKKLD